MHVKYDSSKYRNGCLKHELATDFVEGKTNTTSETIIFNISIKR